MTEFEKAVAAETGIEIADDGTFPIPDRLLVECPDNKMRRLWTQSRYGRNVTIYGSVKVKRIMVSGTANAKLDGSGLWRFKPNPDGRNADVFDSQAQSPTKTDAKPIRAGELTAHELRLLMGEAVD